MTSGVLPTLRIRRTLRCINIFSLFFFLAFWGHISSVVRAPVNQEDHGLAAAVLKLSFTHFASVDAAV